MDESLKAIIEDVESAHTLDDALAAHMQAVADVSILLDRAFEEGDTKGVFECWFALHHYAKGMRHLMSALQRDVRPDWPMAPRARDGESPGR